MSDFRPFSFRQIKKALTKIRVYVTGGFRTTEGMARAIRDGATDGIGLGRPITAELGLSSSSSKTDLPRSILIGKADSAPDTKIPENELNDAILACDTQMLQAGKTTLSQAGGDVNL